MNLEDSIDTPSKPLKIYLDQNIYGHMLDECGDWKRSEIGLIVNGAQEDKTGQVWVGPAHVLETVQCEDETRRKKLAMTMLEVVEARRMWWGHEFEALQDFCNFLKVIAPKALRFHEYLEYHRETLRQLYLGGLGLIASVGTEKFMGAMKKLKRGKTICRLLHARFAVDPDNWITKVLDVVDNWKTTNENTFAEIEEMSDEQMEQEISSSYSQIQKFGKKGLATLVKNRRTIAKRYGAFEIGAILDSVLNLPMEMALVFDLGNIREGLILLQKNSGYSLLTKEVLEANVLDLIQSQNLRALMHGAMKAASYPGVLTTELSYETVLMELQQKLASKEIPGGGLTFDADHSSALVMFDVFVTEDEGFAGNLRTLAKEVSRRSGGVHCPEIAANPKQLRDILKRKH